MKRIEDDLKAALRRKPAPPGFAAKVFHRLEGSDFQKPPKRFPARQSWMAAAAIIVLTAGLSIFAYQRHVEARNEAALQRTLTALSIASEQLEKAEKKAFGPKRWEQIGQYLQEIPIQNDKNRQ
jgi:hypothetical protein